MNILMNNLDRNHEETEQHEESAIKFKSLKSRTDRKRINRAARQRKRQC